MVISLRKMKTNEKIITILVICVLVVIVAAVALTQVPNQFFMNNNQDTPSDIPVVKEYAVDWETQTVEHTSITEYVEKDTAYTDTLLLDQGNLIRVFLTLEWTDDRTTLLGRYGHDTITLKLTLPNGNILTLPGQTNAQNQQGMIYVELPVNEDMPPDRPIRAEDRADAERKLEDDTYQMDKWTNEEIEYQIMVNIGEMRIIPRFRDGGNSFDLNIQYTYYEPTLTQIDNSTDSNQ